MACASHWRSLSCSWYLMIDTASLLPSCEKPNACNRDHHLDLESRSRAPSTLKKASKVIGRPGLLSLGTGRPLPAYFPCKSLAIDAVGSVTAPTRAFEAASSVPSKQAGTKPALSIPQALSYGDAAGAPSLLGFITEHVDAVHKPRYADWKCSLTASTTSAIDMFLRMLRERWHSTHSGVYLQWHSRGCTAPWHHTSRSRRG